MSPQAQELRV